MSIASSTNESSVNPHKNNQNSIKKAQFRLYLKPMENVFFGEEEVTIIIFLFAQFRSISNME